MQRSFARRLVIWLVVTLCVAAGFAIWAVLTGSPDAPALQGLGSALVAGLCIVTGLAGATVLERDDARRSVGLVTILLSGFELALALAAIWGLGSDAVGRALGACSSLLAAFGHASLMLRCVRSDDGRATRLLTAAAVAFSMLGASVLAGAFAFVTGSPGSGYWRLLGVLAVLGTLFTLLALLARRLDPHSLKAGVPGLGL
jgi:FtsH-binding integral membrane protein